MYAQSWEAQLKRSDSNDIRFCFDWKTEKGKPVWYIRNAAERIKVDNIKQEGDSLFVQMPVFESQFRVKKTKHRLEGVWIKAGASRTAVIPFVAKPGNKRFIAAKLPAKNVSGRWAVNFATNKSDELSVGEFKQTGSRLTGTFLNPSGDYRFLEGVVSGDSLYLSGFDGGHAYLFTGIISNNKIVNGKYYASATYTEDWNALKNSKAKVPLESVTMHLRPGEEKLNFSFKDLDGKQVSINDNRFKNKVVVIQLMGSWCPNCMDETAFLSEYYTANKNRGVEIIALAYEYSTDWERSIKSLRKFQQRFNVQYSVLNTGVAVTDSLRTEKTLPELTPIKAFPSTIILDKKGKVRKLDTSFNGPGTGEHYTAYKKEFEETINTLLKEN